MSETQERPAVSADTMTFTKTITEFDVYSFAGITGDFYPIHIDAVYAATQPVGQRVAHGVLLMGLMSTTGARWMLSQSIDGLSYGYEGVRFIRPVLFGDTITVSYTKEGESEDGHKIFAAVHAHNQNGDLVCVAKLLCDRHPADSVAFTIVEPDRSVRKLTFGELQDRSRRFAVALADLGVEQGDRVATLMGKSAEFVIALVGIWRRGAVQVPLFTAFAPPAIAYRLDQSAAKLIVTDFSQRNKLDPGDDIPQAPPWTVIVAGGEPVGENHFTTLLAASDPHDPRGDAVAVGGAAEFGRLFTSGTSGNPKGVPIPVKAIASFLTYFRLG